MRSRKQHGFVGLQRLSTLHCKPYMHVDECCWMFSTAIISFGLTYPLPSVHLQFLFYSSLYKWLSVFHSWLLCNWSLFFQWDKFCLFCRLKTLPMEKAKERLQLPNHRSLLKLLMQSRHMQIKEKNFLHCCYLN